VTTDAITLLPSSRAVARRVGPLAWVILEDLALRARPRADGLVVETNVRELARGLCVGKDTVAKALARLINAGLISVRPWRRAGRFAGCAYAIDTEACGRAGIVVTSRSFEPSPYPIAPRPVAPDTVAEVPAALRAQDLPASLSSALTRPRRTTGASASASSLRVTKEEPSFRRLVEQCRDEQSSPMTRSRSTSSRSAYVISRDSRTVNGKDDGSC
jgi:hypothetical protein